MRDLELDPAESLAMWEFFRALRDFTKPAKKSAWMRSLGSLAPTSEHTAMPGFTFA